LRTASARGCTSGRRARAVLPDARVPPDLGTEYKDYYLVGRCGRLRWRGAIVRRRRTQRAAGVRAGPALAAFERENPGARDCVGRTRRFRNWWPRARADRVDGRERDHPWVIAGLQNDLTNFDDQTEGRCERHVWRLDAPTRTAFS